MGYISRKSVDNFVDSLCLEPQRPYKSRACLNCPISGQFFKTYMNQQLSELLSLSAGAASAGLCGATPYLPLQNFCA
jgi:hypothetical protein